MPDAHGKFKGTGWSREAEKAHWRLARERWLHENAGRPLPPELQRWEDEGGAVTSRTPAPDQVE